MQFQKFIKGDSNNLETISKDDYIKSVNFLIEDENEEYLKVIEKSIKDKKPLTRDMLGEIFMKDNKAVY